ncbi:MAG: terminase family protein [Desulfobacteraceae bacterium]|nr:terminase family protein [Desulfobacteraceae bacterium]
MSAPAVLLPYQQRWISDPATVKVCEKSRRVGISWCEAADAALTASAASGMNVWYLGYNREMAVEFINDTAFWTKHLGIAASEMDETLLRDEGKDILGYRIHYASGCRVTALSSRPSNLRGKQGKVIIDEAAFHGDLPQLLKAAVALLMWGGRLSVISTHNGAENPFNDLVNEIRSGRKPYVLHRITLDDALREGLFRRICLRTGKDWSAEAEERWRGELIDFYGEFAAEELFCVPGQGSGAWLPRPLIEQCMEASVPVLRWSCSAGFAELPENRRRAETDEWCRENLESILESLPENRPSFFGEDFGRSGDLTVIFPLQETGFSTYRAPFAVELRNVPFRQQEQILFFIADRLPRFSAGAMDARGNGQYLAEVASQRYGKSRIESVMLSDKWYRENMPSCRAGFEDRLIAIPRDPDILSDLRAVRIDRGIARVPENSRTKGRDGGKRHGDAAIACVLAWYAAAHGDGGPVEYEQVGERRLTELRGY